MWSATSRVYVWPVPDYAATPIAREVRQYEQQPLQNSEEITHREDLFLLGGLEGILADKKSRCSLQYTLLNQPPEKDINTFVRIHMYIRDFFFNEKRNFLSSSTKTGGWESRGRTDPCKCHQSFPPKLESCFVLCFVFFMKSFVCTQKMNHNEAVYISHQFQKLLIFWHSFIYSEMWRTHGNT